MAKKPTKMTADEVSPLMKGILEQMQGFKEPAPASIKKKHAPMNVQFIDPTLQAADLKKEGKEGDSVLVKSILSLLNGPKDSIERLAFEADPGQHNAYQSLYKAKLRLIPDFILKRIAIQDDLVASILNARSNQISSFGRPPKDRFSMGFSIEPKSGIMDDLDEKGREELQDKIDDVTKQLITCGRVKGWADQEMMTFSQYLAMTTRNALTVGRCSTEIIYAFDASGVKKFHSFRPIDAATIYRAAPQQEAAQQVRDTARKMLEQLKNKHIQKDKKETEDFAWIQVIEGRPVQAFTNEECLVHNFYPVTDVELDGYPLTPIDTMIAAVTTHINITTHNKLYFQSGRASKGMLVIKGDDVDETVVARIKQQFNASINSVNNAWRMPVFGIGAEDEITWSPIDSAGGRDMEFQYLADTNARVILSAFQMSPEELPGYAHLSRGTNNQALSESNNEYKLEAARDVGIRPLVAQLEDMINAAILPLFDADLAEVCQVKFKGLDIDTAEKESVRIQQDMGLHYNYDEVLEKVEKEPIGKKWGGEYPLNPQIQAILDAHFTAGEIEEHFMGREGASKDPSLAFRRDPFWFQWQQLIQQQQQMEQQQQQAQQQQAAGGGAPPQDGGQPAPEASGGAPGGQGGGEGGGGPPQPPAGQEGPSRGSPTEAKPKETELTRGLDQILGLLNKTEAQLPPGKRRLLAQQRKTVTDVMAGWAEDSEKFLDEVQGLAEKHLPPKKG